MLDMDARRNEPARIMVMGLGGGGSNAVNRMISAGLTDVTFWVANTDSQALTNSLCENKHQLGAALTGGLGAGGDPEVGRAAAEEDVASLAEVLEGYDMIFLTAGMGGGTGTGSIPVVARLARSHGALTVAIVTKPFGFENRRRIQRAEEGIAALADQVDTLIVIPNDKLLHLVDRDADFNQGLRVADEILYQSTRGVADIITGNGLVNVDFADVRTVMRNGGAALLGCGVAEGPNRALEAAQAAVSSPLLDDLSIQGASAILINVVGGTDMKFHEVTEAATHISTQAGKECDLFWGAVVDPALGAEMRVTLIATGFQRAPAIRLVERPAAQTQIPAPAPAPPAPAPARPEPEPRPAPRPVAPEPEPAPARSIPEEEPVAARPRVWDFSIAPTRKEESPEWEPIRGSEDADTPASDRWIEEPSDASDEENGGRGPAFWRRRQSRRLRFVDRGDLNRWDDRNRLEIPTFLRKQMD